MSLSKNSYNCWPGHGQGSSSQISFLGLVLLCLWNRGHINRTLHVKTLFLQGVQMSKTRLQIFILTEGFHLWNRAHEQDLQAIFFLLGFNCYDIIWLLKKKKCNDYNPVINPKDFFYRSLSFVELAQRTGLSKPKLFLHGICISIQQRIKWF